MKKSDKVKELTEQLEKGVDEIFQTEEYKKFLDMCANLPRYSVNNQILIYNQTHGKATMVQSFTNWKKLGRHIKKGSKAIKILAPSFHKTSVTVKKFGKDGRPLTDKQGNEITEEVESKYTTFFVVNTFDISQTEGDALPDLMKVHELTGEVENYNELFDKLVALSPVPVKIEDTGSSAKGYFNMAENIIVIKEGMSQVHTIKTLVHELTHSLLHSKESKITRGQKEIEAESVAYIVTKYLGIDTSDYSFGYVAGWSSSKEHEQLKESLKTISKTAKEIIVKLEEKEAV